MDPAAAPQAAPAASATLSQWFNTPLFFINQTPITLSGLAGALIIFFGAFVLSAALRRAITARLTKRLGLHPGVVYAISRILHYAIVLTGVVIAAQCVGLNFGSLAVVVGFLSVGIGFGLQNVTANFISGLILLFERPISVGDFITVDGTVGTVANIGMRSTVIRTLDNVSLIVPNSTFVENAVTNWSRGDPRVRLRVPIGVAYGSDTARLTEELLRVARGHQDVLADPPPEVRFLEFGNSSLDFALLAWINQPERQFRIHSELNYAIDAALRAAGIAIPFPQRDVHVQLTLAIERLAGAAR